MKKILLIITAAFLLTMCSSSKTGKSNTTTAAAKPEVQYKDDFRAAGDKERNALLKELKATAAGYSVLIFTKNYKGEKITVSNATSRLYSGYLISNLKTGIAGNTRIDNSVDTRVFDNLTKKEAVIDAKEAQKHKYIYLMKEPGAPNPFVITYSNTLRPLE
jgi:hypothetical protein